MSGNAIRNKSTEFIRKNIGIGKLLGLKNLSVCSFSLDSDTGAVTIEACSRRHSARCPTCGGNSRSVHSHYIRKVSDLPVSGRKVAIQLLTRRFRCPHPNGRVRSVSAFANMLNVTPKYLSKCVKEESGRSPLDHIHEITINTIRQHLRYGNKTIKEISTALYFPNLSFFGRFVKEHLGMSPTEYRQKNLKEG